MLKKISLSVKNSVLRSTGRNCVAIATTKAPKPSLAKFSRNFITWPRSSPIFFFWNCKILPICEKFRISEIHDVGS